MGNNAQTRALIQKLASSTREENHTKLYYLFAQIIEQFRILDENPEKINLYLEFDQKTLYLNM